jgi:hypothetical protein
MRNPPMPPDHFRIEEEVTPLTQTGWVRYASENWSFPVLAAPEDKQEEKP